MKIEESELKKLQQLHSDNTDAKSNLADTVVRLDQLSKQKESQMQRVGITSEILEQYQSELIGKYGIKNSFRIDMMTGEVTELE